MLYFLLKNNVAPRALLSLYNIDLPYYRHSVAKADM